MARHADLTGDELHEPKGVDATGSNNVYVSDGAGSGSWLDRYEGHFIRNLFWRDGEITDVSTANSNCYIYVPVDCELTEIACITHAPLTTANAILSIYINGVLFADTLTVVQSGSVAGTLHRAATVTPNTIPAYSVVEIRSNGASDTVSKGKVTLGFRAN